MEIDGDEPGIGSSCEEVDVPLHGCKGLQYSIEILGELLDTLFQLNEEHVVVERSDCVYVISQELVRECSKIEKVSKRALLVHSLLTSYKLTTGMTVVPLHKLSVDDLLEFHSRDYVEFLKFPERFTEEDFGLGYDCPVVENLAHFATTLASGSVTAAEFLIRGKARVAINWCGGWHHAKRDSASGFCYVNDIVLAIHRLQKVFSRVMYVDLDVHHGDGVEDAFSSTDKVFTLSVHKHGPGYFPGSGGVGDVGYGRGRYYSVNVPLADGVDDSMYCSLFARVLSACTAVFPPQVVVVQCGADCLAGDPLGGFNLTPAALSYCVQQVLKLKVPVLLLGGGGYNIPNAARCWARITADLIGAQIEEEIPDHDPFFLKYGPDYELSVFPGYARNKNSTETVNAIIEKIEKNLTNIRPQHL